MNAKDFYDWKRHPVTQVAFSQLAARVTDLKEHLSEHAGKNPAEDKFHTGYIAAFNDLIRMEYEGEVESQ